MCCDAEWKREVVQDHKWDFINVNEFRKTDFLTRFKYVWRYILLFKSLAVYGLDIFTAVTMISSDRWNNAITAKGSEGVVEVKFIIAKWVFVGCIIFSFLLLGYEWYKARQVVKSQDISYAFTNLLANDYFSFKNYDNFCLFCHIEGSTKKKDDFAFFIFFTFKEWKRLLLADGPRQSINGLMLYSFGQANGWQTSNIPAYWNEDPITAMLLFSMIATVLIFAGSMLLLIAAAVLYVPLLCYIQGNLKEYVCHKVDKRLSELVKKKQRLRAQRAAALEKKLARDGGLRNSKGEFVNVVMQPTLPKIMLDDEDMRETKTGMARSKSADTLASYPSSTPGVNEVYGGYPPSLDYHQSPYGNDVGFSSTTRLIDHSGPMGISYPPPVATPPDAAPSFPPRGSSPAPPPGMRPSRSNTQM
ncbi:putative vacuole protein, partial [Dioszegia hungarica]